MENFLSKPSKSKHGKKTGRPEYMANLHFYTSKYVMNRERVERQPTNWEKITYTKERGFSIHNIVNFF